MSTFLRFCRILHTIGRYRLDNLFSGSRVTGRFKPLFALFKLYPSSDIERGRRLRLALEELGPIFVKFGQLLSTRPDLIAQDVVQELNHLQDNVAPFDNDTFRAIVEDSLGTSVEEFFTTFEHSPLASASVAQVHAAELKSGEQVIVKAIRPGIEKTIRQDINLLLFFAKLIEKISSEGRRLRPVEIVEDYNNTIFDELNLALEAANASQLRRNFANSNNLYVPRVFWNYSKKNIMVMERIYGIPVTDIEQLNAQHTNMRLLAERGVEIFFRQVFEHNFFHADMHPGNVFVSREDPSRPTYIAVDMAIMGSLTREDQYYLARNLLAMFRRDYRQVAELHVSSGWVPAETSVSGFEAAIRSVCEPIFEKPLKEISFGEALITIFKTARRYDMPVQPQLVLLQKTLLNIEGLGRQLYPDLNLWDTAHPFLERWIKQRFHLSSLWKEFRHNAPEWMEKVPQMPHMLFDALDEIKHVSSTAHDLVETQQQLLKVQRHRGRLRYAIALGAIAGAVYFSWPTITQIDGESLLLLAIAICTLAF